MFTVAQTMQLFEILWLESQFYKKWQLWRLSGR